jgi:hypothetical protein
MSHLQPFAPSYGRTQIVTAGASSASISIGLGVKNLMILNTGANIGYIRVGVGAQTATTADFPIRNGANPISITKAEEADTLAYISAAGTTFIITPGEGWL